MNVCFFLKSTGAPVIYTYDHTFPQQSALPFATNPIGPTTAVADATSTTAIARGAARERSTGTPRPAAVSDPSWSARKVRPASASGTPAAASATTKIGRAHV